MKVSALELEFLGQSNAIESVYDEDSLVQACHAWYFMKRQKKMTIGVLLKTHKILMLNQPLYPNEKGYFRRCDVFIGGKKKMFISEALFKDELKTLFEKMNSEDDVENVIKEAWSRTAHVMFENIHPFVDGNGRVGRMLYNWHRLKMELPLHVIHTGEEQKQYYSWFYE